MTEPAASSKWAHPWRSNPPSSGTPATGRPGAWITPSTETWIVAVSFSVPSPVVGSLVGPPEGRPASRSIRLEHDPGRRRSRFDELQVVRLATLGEEPQPFADDHRVDPQVELVDEVALEQPSEQLAAAVDLELAARLRLELADRRLDVAGDDLGRLPARILERGRRHVLGQDVDPVGDGIAAVVVRPVRLPDLPGLASEQER